MYCDMLHSAEVSEKDSSIIAAFVLSLIALMLATTTLLFIIYVVRKQFLRMNKVSSSKCTNICA